MQKWYAPKPDNHEAWSNRGLALTCSKRYEDALQSYQQALAINPNDANTYYNQACCYAVQNNIQLAIENLRHAITLDTQYQEMAKTDTDFDSIREDVQFQDLLG